MRYLVISDIHANWEALEAVLEHAEGNYDQICCLGDVVGYGADPNPVTEWVRENVPQVIRGNHDKVCCGLEGPDLFNPIARQAAQWTQRVLSEENNAYLRGLRRGPVDVDGFLVAHGSVLDEDEYLLDPRDAEEQFESAKGRLVFFGHTHVQGGFLLHDLGKTIESGDSSFTKDAIRVVPGESQLLNPGSIGQPRDLDWRAAYALYDTKQQTVEFRRCDYDVETAQRKILDVGLPTELAERLAEGR